MHHLTRPKGRKTPSIGNVGGNTSNAVRVGPDQAGLRSVVGCESQPLRRFLQLDQQTLGRLFKAKRRRSMVLSGGCIHSYPGTRDDEACYFGSLHFRRNVVLVTIRIGDFCT